MALGRNAQLDPPLFQPFLAICTRRRLPRQMISLDKRLLREQASMRRAKWETACGERDSAHGPREGVTRGLYSPTYLLLRERACSPVFPPTHDWFTFERALVNLVVVD